MTAMSIEGNTMGLIRTQTLMLASLHHDAYNTSRRVMTSTTMEH